MGHTADFPPVGCVLLLLIVWTEPRTARMERKERIEAAKIKMQMPEGVFQKESWLEDYNQKTRR